MAYRFLYFFHYQSEERTLKRVRRKIKNKVGRLGFETSSGTVDLIWGCMAGHTLLPREET